MLSEPDRPNTIQVICTRPRQQNEDPHWNAVSIDLLSHNNPEFVRQRSEVKCQVCGMSLILSNRYVPIHELGSGGFGRTFQSLDCDFWTPGVEVDRQEVVRVIKQFRTDRFLTGQHLDRAEKAFEREKHTLAQLNHDHIPRVYACFKLLADIDIRLTGQQRSSSLPRFDRPYFFYLVQDYVAGHDLRQELQARLQGNSRYLEREIRELLQQLLPVLDYLHTRPEPIIHRDIKPENIVHSIEGRYYLIDFGTVKQILPILERGFAPSETGFVSAGFSPPEQYDRQVTFSSDLYCLAMTCVCLLTGTLITQNSSDSKDVRSFGIPHNRDRWREQAQVSRGLGDLLNKMLEPEARDRYQSAAAVLEALKKLPLSSKKSQSLPFAGLGARWAAFEQWRRSHNEVFYKAIAGIALLVGGVAISAKWIPLPKPLVGIPWVIEPPSRSPSPSVTPISVPISADELPHYFSRGEEAIAGKGSRFEPSSQDSECNEAIQQKREGIRLFKAKQYPEAIEQFEHTLDEHFDGVSAQARTAIGTCTYDPETRIFYNNAQAIDRGNPLTLVVVVPLSSQEDVGYATELLLGAAHVQQKFNQDRLNDPSKQLLQLLIVRGDDNTEDAAGAAAHAGQLAQLIKGSQIPGDSDPASLGTILGVIGHASATIRSVGAVYGEDLAVISPISTVTRGTDDFKGAIFRTAPTDAIAGKDLADYAKQKFATRPNPKISVIFSSSPGILSYSESLKNQFQKHYGQSNIQACDVLQKGIAGCFNEATGSAAILLTLTVNDQNIDLLRNRIGSIPRGQGLFAGDALYRNRLVANGTANGMVISIPWHRSANLADLGMFSEEAQRWWRTAEISWRSAITYDAMVAFTRAIELSEAASNPPTAPAITSQQVTPQQVTPQQVIEKLKQENFAAIGLTGTVKFCDGDRMPQTGLGVLVEVNYSDPKLYKPISTPPHSGTCP